MLLDKACLGKNEQQYAMNLRSCEDCDCWSHGCLLFEFILFWSEWDERELQNANTSLDFGFVLVRGHVVPKDICIIKSFVQNTEGEENGWTKLD